MCQTLLYIAITFAIFETIIKLSISFEFKGNLPQNIFILKSGQIVHINSLNIGGLHKLQFELFFVP